jgi:hypothetical protein
MSSGIALMEAERIVIAKPAWTQIMITMRNRLFHGSVSRNL